MSDLKVLVDRILSEIKKKGSKNFHDIIYRDEPIIRKASQMKSYLPEQIVQMKKIASQPGAYYQTEAYIFYCQAKFMEDYEDDYQYGGTFFNYFPTYQKMTNDQLRGYFTWRTNLRKGEITKTSLSFAYVYLYELLLCVGSKTPQEGYEKFRSFCEAYGELDSQILRYTKNWLADFVVYYDLDKALLEEAGEADNDFYNSLMILKNCNDYADDKLFEAVCQVSSYDIRNFKLYKTMPEDTEFAVSHVFRSLSEYYGKNRSKSLFEKLFGVKTEIHYEMFGSAVFYDGKRYEDHTYEINDFWKFHCKNGRWSCEKYYTNRKNKWLGEVVKAVDSIMRQRLDFGYPVSCPVDTKWLIAVINKEIDAMLENRRKKAEIKVEIDVSKLAGIRRSADITRDKLMTDEEREVTDKEAPKIFENPEASEESISEKYNAFTQNDTPLNDEEYQFMHSLLYGGSFTGKTMPSVLADSVNEKLYDIFGDVTIEFEGDKPVVIEDYANDLKGMIPE